jgi:hypothetical protein
MGLTAVEPDRFWARVDPEGAPVKPDVYGSEEVREVLGGISRGRLSQIVNDPAKAFPPHTVLAIGRVWDGPLVRAWQEARTKPRRQAMYRFACSYRATGNIAHAARHVGVHYKTGVNWTRELGLERMDGNR